MTTPRKPTNETLRVPRRLRRKVARLLCRAMDHLGIGAEGIICREISCIERIERWEATATRRTARSAVRLRRPPQLKG